jgi:crotonobetainyl-CoA:carnitine CoA-transferase CaiB-like acyl-CoA transferase
MAPHGAYPTAGEDEWIAIAARDESDWRKLCTVMERARLIDDPRYASLEARMEHAEALDAEIASWTRALSAPEVEQRLQAAGVPAHVVMHTGLAAEDPQLRDSSHFIEVPHARHGPVLVESTRYSLSRTPALVSRAAPTIGEHTDWVLRTILGYDDGRIETLRNAGALG